MDKGKIKGQAVAKRALEIAALGDHCIALIGPRFCGKHTLQEAFPEAKRVIVCDTCACGNYMHTSRECTCPERMLYRWLRRVKIGCETHADMIVEVPPVPYREVNSPDDPDYQRHFDARIDAARKFRESDKRPMKLDDAGERTMEMAARRLSLPLGRIARIKAVARTIADLDGSEAIKAKHVAEAIQYSAMLRTLGD